MTGSVIQTAKEIVELGVEDPDLFVAMALFEEGFGPDRISDMTTNVILGDLLRFNARILDGLPVPREAMTLRLRNGKTYETALPVNPYVKGGTRLSWSRPTSCATCLSRRTGPMWPAPPRRTRSCAGA